MRISMLVGMALALVVGAGAAQAQIGGFPGGRGGFPGGRGGMGGRGGPRYNVQRRAEVPDLNNPVKFILQRKDSLALTADEVQKVDSVARLVDRQNDTLIAQVKRAFGEDSASMASGGGRPRARRGEGEDPEGEDLALQDRIKVLKPTFEAIKKNNDAGWKAATALLTKDQKKQAERMRRDDEKERQQEKARWQRRQGPEGY